MTLEKCCNVSSKTPQLGESPQSSGEMLASPRSPDYPPRVSASPNSPDTTFVSTLLTNPQISMDTAKYNSGAEAVTPGTPVMDEPFGALTNNEKNSRSTIVKSESEVFAENIQRIRPKQETIDEKSTCNEPMWSASIVKTEIPVEIDSTTSHAIIGESTTITTTSTSERAEKPLATSTEKRSGKEHSERRHCSRCYKRSKIKRASIGVQCKRDRTSNPLQPQQKHITGPFQKSNSENLRLNLGTKNFKVLHEKPKHDPLENLKYKKFIHIETYPNGGATVVHMYQDEIAVLPKEQVEELAQEYFKVWIIIRFSR